MTEDEAKTKYCPMGGRSVSIKQGGEFRVGDFTKCIASDCMMWRWKRTKEDARKQSGLSAEYQAKESGYCGLAK